MGMSEADAWLRRNFPNLRSGQYQITSSDTRDYNCLAWAASETDRKWNPLDPDDYWPLGVTRAQTKDAFIAAYETRGFVECYNSEVEHGYEKIAIYANAVGPQHAARQLGNGAWTSKLGDGWDIEHPTLEGVECGDYGHPIAYMKREVILK